MLPPLEILEPAKEQRLSSEEHFSVDSTLTEAWASVKSFRPKDEDPPSDGGRTPEVDFRGERRSNDTQRSTTDPNASLAKVEEVLAWVKTVGGDRKLRYCGVERNRFWMEMTTASYNLVRLSRMLPIARIRPSTDPQPAPTRPRLHQIRGQPQLDVPRSPPPHPKTSQFNILLEITTTATAAARPVSSQLFLAWAACRPTFQTVCFLAAVDAGHRDCAGAIDILAEHLRRSV